MRRSQLSALPTRVTGTRSDRETPRSGPLRTISSPASGSEHVEDCLIMMFAVPCEHYRNAAFADARKSAGDAQIVRTSVQLGERRRVSDPILTSSGRSGDAARQVPLPRNGFEHLGQLRLAAQAGDRLDRRRAALEHQDPGDAV